MIQTWPRSMDEGKVIKSVVFKRRPKQRITREAPRAWFETPCPAGNDGLNLCPPCSGPWRRLPLLAADLLPDGPHKPPRRAQGFRSVKNLDSAILSMAGARELGLIAVPRETVEG